MYNCLIDKYLMLQDLKGHYNSVFIVNNYDKFGKELKETLFNYFNSDNYSIKELDDHIYFKLEDKELYLYNYNQGIIET